MNVSRPSYRWSDAWLLTAIYAASRQGAPTLSKVIGAGDFINHAIFTLSELNGGLSRLRRGGFIEIQAGCFPLTSEGRVISEMDQAQPAGPFKHMEELRKRLAAPAWLPGDDPNAADDPVDQTACVTKEDFARAFDEYRRSLKKPKPKKRERGSPLAS